MPNRRSSPHVRQEVVEVPPSLADLDTPTSVILKTGVLRISTALDHRAPYAELDWSWSAPTFPKVHDGPALSFAARASAFARPRPVSGNSATIPSDNPFRLS